MALLDRFLKSNDQNPDDVRMTLGEHLDELRNRLIRSVIALSLGGVICYIFMGRIQAALTDALYDVLAKYNYPRTMVYTGVADPFVIAFQLALILGFILTAPYIIWQMWGFVAAGLYKHERKWVRRFIPVSIALFFIGTAFFLIVVIPLFLDFFISYQTEVPDLPVHIRGLLGPHNQGIPVSQPYEDWPQTGAGGTTIPVFQKDPINPPEGGTWINAVERDQRVQVGGKTYIVNELKESGHRNRIQPMIDIKHYLIFMLQMAAAFGVGFQVPVVVAFLSTIGIASAKAMASVRKYVYFGICIVAAFVTPSPDITSMMLLFVPMIVLYEIGLVASRFIERERQSKPA